MGKVVDIKGARRPGSTPKIISETEPAVPHVFDFAFRVTCTETQANRLKIKQHELLQALLATLAAMDVPPDFIASELKTVIPPPAAYVKGRMERDAADAKVGRGRFAKRPDGTLKGEPPLRWPSKGPVNLAGSAEGTSSLFVSPSTFAKNAGPPPDYVPKFHFSVAGKHVCTTKFVSPRNLVLEREKVTCKLCKAELGIP